MAAYVLPEAPERTEIEPTESTAAPPPARKPDKPAGPSRTRRVLRATRTGAVALILIAGAAAGGTYVVKQKIAASHYVRLDKAVLAADPIPVGSAGSGTVTDLLVDEHSHVVAGDVLARITMSAVSPNGVPKPPVVAVLRAPVAGTVSEINIARGGLVQAGEPIVTLYDEGKLTFHAKVSPDQLRLLRLGMTAKVSGPGLGHGIPATLGHVVPKVTTDQTTPASTSDKLTVVLVPRPADMTTVTSLVPGLQYKAVVDTKTAVGGTDAVNSAR